MKQYNYWPNFKFDKIGIILNAEGNEFIDNEKNTTIYSV